MFKNQMKIIVSVLMLVINITGCQKNETISIEEPSMASKDLSSGKVEISESSVVINEESSQGEQGDSAREEIKSILLKDYQGNTIRNDFSDFEIQELVYEFYNSEVLDTPYIEMITGYTLTFILEENRSVFIHSYGNPEYIIASITDEGTYHLRCEFIGKLLLDQN